MFNEISFKCTDSYPEKDMYPDDRVASLQSLQKSLTNAGLSTSVWSPFFTSLLVRFSYKGALVPHDDYKLAHFSLEAAHFIKDFMKSKIIAVQAPSMDRAECKGCDVHRVLFGLELLPKPQTTLREDQGIPDLILGENFNFPMEIQDGPVVFEAGGVNLTGLDVTLSNSYIYPLLSISRH